MDVWLYRQTYIEHHGIKGQRWGIRRYQNPDGSLTDLGRKRYGTEKTLDKAFKENDRNIKSVYGQEVAKSVAKKAGALAVATGAGVLGTAAGFAGAAPSAVAGYLAASTALGPDADRAEKYATEYLDKYNTLSKQKVRIVAGTEFNRTEIGDLSTSDLNRVYVLYKKDKYGSKYYDNDWAEQLRRFANDPDVQVNKNTYRVKADIIAADKDTRIKIANEMFNEKAKLYDRVIKTNLENYARRLSSDWTTKDISNKLKDTPALKKMVDDYAAELTSLRSKNMNNAAKYNSFMSALPKDDKLFKEYIKRLSDKGYGAMYDDNSRMAAKAPFIIFDKSLLEKIDSKVLLDGGAA